MGKLSSQYFGCGGKGRATQPTRSIHFGYAMDHVVFIRVNWCNGPYRIHSCQLVSICRTSGKDLPDHSAGSPTTFSLRFSTSNSLLSSESSQHVVTFRPPGSTACRADFQSLCFPFRSGFKSKSHIQRVLGLQSFRLLEFCLGSARPLTGHLLSWKDSTSHLSSTGEKIHD